MKIIKRSRMSLAEFIRFWHEQGHPEAVLPALQTLQEEYALAYGGSDSPVIPDPECMGRLIFSTEFVPSWYVNEDECEIVRVRASEEEINSAIIEARKDAIKQRIENSRNPTVSVIWRALPHDQYRADMSIEDAAELLGYDDDDMDAARCPETGMVDWILARRLRNRRMKMEKKDAR